MRASRMSRARQPALALALVASVTGAAALAAATGLAAVWWAGGRYGWRRWRRWWRAWAEVAAGSVFEGGQGGGNDDGGEELESEYKWI